jgi:hypothetical protein
MPGPSAGARTIHMFDAGMAMRSGLRSGPKPSPATRRWRSRNRHLKYYVAAGGSMSGASGVRSDGGSA